MADPVATVEKIVKVGLKIKDAVDTVRHNKEECDEIRRRVLRFSAILSQLQQTGLVNDSPAMSGALEDLEESLQHALELVMACQEKSTIRHLIRAGDMSKQLRRVKDDILNKVMLASFAINAHTTIVLLTIQAGGHLPPRLQLQDTGAAEASHNADSTDDARCELDPEETGVSGAPLSPLEGFKKFSLCELKAAIKDGNTIGKGGFFNVYKGILNDGTVVAIKRAHTSTCENPYDQCRIVSKLQHKNIVKCLGYGHEVKFSSRKWMWNRKNDQEKETEFFLVEEYMPNGSLDMLIDGSQQFNCSSLFRIIQGIAQGLHYLHEQHVIHLDLKPSNILLDSNMNAKIGDFGLSITVDDTGVNMDRRIVGTWKYIEPEYCLTGSATTKNDVYSFGITLLETVHSISRCKSTDTPLHLWAWEAWEAGRIEEEFDPSLFDGSQLIDMKRYVVVGLLCAQGRRAYRPSMADVLKMLNGNKELPTPKKPEQGYILSDEERSSTEHLDGEMPASPSAWSDGSMSPR